MYLDPATNPDAVLTAHAQCAACEFDVRGDLVTPKPALTAGLDALLAQRPCLARDHERPTASR